MLSMTLRGGRGIYVKPPADPKSSTSGMGQNFPRDIPHRHGDGREKQGIPFKADLA